MIKSKIKLINNYEINIQKHFGFTLAEVLITLGIIGVVAAMTIPALINNTQENEYKTAYKKGFSMLSQAFEKAQANGDITELTGTYSSQGMETNFAALQKQFNISKSCTNSQTQGCWDTSGELWRTEDYTVQGFIDNSGMAWKLRRSDSAQLTPAILLDTNGLKGPNQYGKDRFPLFLSITGSTDGYTTINLLSPIGMPTKVASNYDIPLGTTDSIAQTMCPSYPKHACYNTSWLMGTN